MKRAFILSLLALPLGGAGAWFALGDPEPSIDVTETTHSLAGHEELDEPAQLAVSPQQTNAEKPIEQGAPEGLPALFREAVEGERGESRVLVVQIWDGKPGVPALDTDVYFLDGFDGPELRDPFAPHWGSLAEGKGTKFRTDGKGRVELPAVRDWAIVTAQREACCGFIKIGRKHRSVETITLRRDETVTVQVVDGDDKPVAGVPVGIVQHVPSRPGVQRDQSTAMKEPPVTVKPLLRSQRKTDAQGLATFRHFQLYRRQREPWWDPGHDSQFEAVLLIPLQQARAVAFAGHPVPQRTLKLQLPPTGSITLRTVDRDGRPFTHPVTADVRIKTDTPAPWSRMRERKTQNATEIVFPFVGPGCELFGSCTLDDMDFRWKLEPFSGPRNAGEDVTIEVVVAPTAGMFFGRLLDGSGTPLAGLRPGFVINTSAGRIEVGDVTTDRDGRFHLPYEVRNHHTGPYRLEIRRKDVRPVAGLAVGLTGLPKAQVTDLGELQLDPFGLIAAGRVVDDRGVPIPGAIVQLQRERSVGESQPKRVYVDETFVTVRTDNAGRYELYGELEPGRYRLRGLAQRHFSSDSPDLGANKQVDLKLDRLSKVACTVLMPSFARGHHVLVRLQSVVDPKNRRDDRLHDRRGKQYIDFDRVRPGLYDLELRIQGFPDPVYRLDNFEVRPGPTDRHPQLTNIDLTTRLHQFSITAVDENGRRVTPDWPLVAKIVRPEGRTAFVGFPWKDKGGVLEILSTSPQLEVWPRASGFRTERPSLLLAPGRNEIRLLQTPPVVVQLPGLRAAVGKSAMVRVQLQQVQLQQVQPQARSPQSLERWDGLSGRIAGWYDDLKRREAGALLRQDDTARIPTLADGRYRVMVFLVSTNGTRNARPEVIPGGTITARIVPGGEPQKLTVALKPDLVRQAYARLAQREAGSDK